MLKSPIADSFDLYERFYTDAEASHAYGGPISRGETWTRLKADLGSWHLSGFGIWIITMKNENEQLGTCGFWQGKGWPRELTWWLLPEARGKGLAHEASRAAIVHAYNVFGWESVETYMKDNNEPARLLAERLDGVKKGRQQFPDGLTRDIFVFPKPVEKQQ